jgi:OmcA/MtrC family decaheme c-type cytochrome
MAVVLGSALLISSPAPTFSKRDKAYYLDEQSVAFVRPGLQITITRAEIANDGTITANFKLTDPRGLPLDRTGVQTPGNVSVSFIAATIPAGQEHYRAYTTRTQTSPITNVSAMQAAGENNGTFTTVGEGEYRYTFRTRAPANIDRGATHAIGAYGSRNLSEFDLGTQYDDAVFKFVPNGNAVTNDRDIIRTETCNKCHNQLAFHGGSRRTMELCNLCHTPSTFAAGANDNIDPDTGNSIDMTVMTHKIHMGADLPSVQAGGKYQIYGNQQSLHDYSNIQFTAITPANCTACHGQDSAAQKDDWLNQPTRRACGACHDDVNFATGQGHATGLPQLSDSQCATCHTPQGELEFDASIKGAHQIPRHSSMLAGVNFQITQVHDGTAGNRPTVGFTIKDDKGNSIPASDLATLRLYVAGPTTDYSSYVSEDARRADCSSQGVCFWTFSRALPQDAKGTYAIYIEGYKNVTLMPGTTKEQSVRDAGENVVHYFAVDGSQVTPRRQVVSLAKCDNCHGDLAFHGDQRTTTEGCVVCHNPNETDAARRPADQMPAQSVDFMTMIHRIHTGNDLEHEFTIYGFGNVAHDFTHLGYPGDRANCDACHVNGSQQLPLPATNMPVKDPRGVLDPMMPATAACTSCHSSTDAKSHALANTTRIGESCAACHGPNAEFSVDRVHSR